MNHGAGGRALSLSDLGRLRIFLFTELVVRSYRVVKALSGPVYYKLPDLVKIAGRLFLSIGGICRIVIIAFHVVHIVVHVRGQ